MYVDDKHTIVYVRTCCCRIDVGVHGVPIHLRYDPARYHYATLNREWLQAEDESDCSLSEYSLDFLFTPRRLVDCM